MSVLVSGSNLDPHIQRVCDALVDCGEEVLRYTPEDDALEFSVEGDLKVNGVAESPTAVFSRINVFGYDTSDTLAYSFYGNCHYAVCAWASLCGIPCVPGYPRKGINCKVNNLAVAKKHGLKIPDTLVSNVAASRCVRKPLQGGDYAVIADEGGVNGLGPAFHQRLIEGKELRVYVAGEETAGFCVESDSLDYRVSQDARLARTDVPRQLSEKLLAVCRDIGLRYAAADFRVEGEEPVFLEVNSNPMFAAFDDVSDGLVAKMIATLLAA